MELRIGEGKWRGAGPFTIFDADLGLGLWFLYVCVCVYDCE